VWDQLLEKGAVEAVVSIGRWRIGDLGRGRVGAHRRPTHEVGRSEDGVAGIGGAIEEALELAVGIAGIAERRRRVNLHDLDRVERRARVAVRAITGCATYGEIGASDGVKAAVVARHSTGDRKSTRLNSSHLGISYAVFCLKK